MSFPKLGLREKLLLLILALLLLTLAWYYGLYASAKLQVQELQAQLQLAQQNLAVRRQWQQQSALLQARKAELVAELQVLQTQLSAVVSMEDWICFLDAVAKEHKAVKLSYLAVDAETTTLTLAGGDGAAIASLLVALEESPHVVITALDLQRIESGSWQLKLQAQIIFGSVSAGPEGDLR